MSSRFERIIFDTNVLLSAALNPVSPSADAYFTALENAALLTSVATLLELREVLARTKFNRYVTQRIRRRFLEIYEDRSKPCAVLHVVDECRDPRDNKFLELALSGRAELIVTGDRDLLVLHPWRGVAVLTPAMYLESER
jgi:putative PIN family toxin of toxin-antitoxin system